MSESRPAKRRASGPCPSRDVGGQERLAVALRAARVTGVDADARCGEHLPLPHQRPAVERRRSAVDLDDDRGGVALRVRRCRDEPALDAAAVDLVPALDRRDEPDSDPRLAIRSLTGAAHAGVPAQPARRERRPRRRPAARPGRPERAATRRAAARQADEGRAARKCRSRVRRSTRPPSTSTRHSSKRALDRRAEDDPSAIGHPGRRLGRPPIRSLFMPPAASRSGPAMRFSASPSRTRRRQTEACVISPRFQSRLPMAAIHRPSGDHAGAPQPAARDPARAGAPPRADVDEVDVAAPAEVRVRVAVADERDLAAVGRPLRVGVVVVAGRQQLGRAAAGVDEPEAGEPLVDEPGAIELVAERVDQSRVGLGRVIRLALGLSSRARWSPRR